MDINDNKYNKKNPTSELLLKEVTDYEIYRYYIGNFKVGKAFNSPLRQDNIPSFGIYPSKKYPGKLFFKDHRGASGDAIVFVKNLFNIDYKTALDRIIVDFNLSDKFFINDNSLKQLKKVEYRLDKDSRIEFEASKLDLEISSRDWEVYDINFWKSYGIVLETLKLFNVTPIKYYWMYGKIYKADKYAYAYIEYKDNELNYKIYQPYREGGNHKFLNGFLDGTFSGWNLLPKRGRLLIITKAAKDTMFLYQRGYNVISPQGEGYIYKPKVIDLLKLRFEKIVMFYDHDKAGINSMYRNRELYGLEFITTCSTKEREKDITDYYKQNGPSETEKLLEDILK